MSNFFGHAFPAGEPYRAITKLRQKQKDVLIKALDAKCKAMSEDHQTLLRRSTNDVRHMSLHISLRDMDIKFLLYNLRYGVQGNPGFFGREFSEEYSAHDTIINQFTCRKDVLSGTNKCYMCKLPLKHHAMHTCGHNICQECVVVWRTMTHISTTRIPCPFCHKGAELESDENILVTRSGRRIRRKPYTRAQ